MMIASAISFRERLGRPSRRSMAGSVPLPFQVNDVPHV